MVETRRVGPGRSAEFGAEIRPHPQRFDHLTTRIRGQIPKWLKGPDCKSGGYAFGGSNPSLPIADALEVGGALPLRVGERGRKRPRPRSHAAPLRAPPTSSASAIARLETVRSTAPFCRSPRRRVGLDERGNEGAGTERRIWRGDPAPSFPRSSSPTRLRGCSSIGRAPAFQAGRCGFEPHHPLLEDRPLARLCRARSPL